MSVDFGLGLLAGPQRDAPHGWQAALDASLPQFVGHIESLWMTDHFFWPDHATFEAWTVLSYMAGKWPQFMVGPMVLGQSYRNPALLALMGATLQTLTNGRFIMAIGAGWKEDEYHAYGYPYPAAKIRLEQLRDTLEILKRMWTSPDPVTYHGKHYSIENAYCEPKPDPVPPIIVGGGGKTTMHLAVEYADWWNISDANLEKYLDRLSILHQHCEELGRDPSTLRLTWFGRLAVGKTEQEAQRRGGERWTRANAFVGTPDQIVEDMLAFVDRGVDYFMMEIQDLPNQDVIDMVIHDILPRVRAGR